MATFGEKLRRERESHAATIEDISAATGILLGYLEALERDDFRALPGRAFGKLYIRAYAEALGFDPQLLIDEYDRAQGPEPQASTDPPRQEPVPPRRAESVIARWRQAARAERGRTAGPVASLEIVPGGSAESSDEAPAVLEIGEARGPGEGDPEQAPRIETVEVWLEETTERAADVPVELDAVVSDAADTPRGVPRHAGRFWSRRPGLAAVGFFGLGVAIVWGLLALTGSGAEEGGPASAVAPSRGTPSADTPRIDRGRAAAAVRPTAPSGSAAAPRALVVPPSPGQLVVTEHAVGRRIVARDLVDPADRFGLWEVAWFWTRVGGAESGDLIHHVWLHEGRVMQSIELEVDGPDWRTHSRKTLGRPGRWQVEARGEDGRVLARATFTCAADQ